MSSQALEQMLSSVPRMGQEDRAYQTLDVYTSGLSQMYTGPMGPPSGGPGPEIGPIGGPSSPGGILQRPDYLEGGIERYRQPELNHDNTPGTHMNYETIIPGLNDNRPIINIHIPMDKY